MDRRRSGTMGEIIAACFLTLGGYEVLARNFRGHGREIDIVARTGRRVVFVEVKLRRTGTYGPPREAVDRRKRSHIVSAARAYLIEHGLADSAVRFDVIEVVVRKGARGLVVRHLPGAFSADGLR